MKELLLASIFITMLIASGCGGSGGDSTNDNGQVPHNYNINGYVQKGPFIRGATITIQELQLNLDPTGRTFSTETSDDFGAFSIFATLDYPYVEIIASGFYFNETNGDLSSSQLTLRAMSDLSSNESVNVNVLTHLERNRLIELVANGSPFAEAKRQAESEILSIFNITESDVSSFDLMNIAETGSSNSILLAASSILQQLATMEASPGSTVTAELSQLLSLIKSDIKPDGVLDDPALINSISVASNRLNPIEVRQNLENRYIELGLEVNIPAFEDYVYSNKVWVRQFGSNSGEFADSVSVDSNGNIYVVGRTFGDMNGYVNAGSEDSYIVKYSSNGIHLWTRQFGTGQQDSSYDSAVASDGSIYLVGMTEGDLGGSGKIGNFDAFVTKYSLEGVAQWTHQFGTESYDSAKSVAVDYDGNIYVAGFTQGNLDTNINKGSYDVFLVKYNSDGIGLWLLQFGTSYSDIVMDMAVDSSGSIYVVGMTEGDLDGNGNLGNNDAFVAKYSQDGIMLWIKQFGTTTHDWAHGVTIDSNGNVYVVGHTGDDLAGNGNIGKDDAFLLKYDSEGSKQWTRQFGTTSNEYAKSVAIDTRDNVFVVGFTGGDLDGYDALGEYDPFIVKYTIDGNMQWLFQFGTFELDRAQAVAIDDNNNIYVTGYTCEYFGGGSGGEYDAFLVKFLL